MPALSKLHLADDAVFDAASPNAPRARFVPSCNPLNESTWPTLEQAARRDPGTPILVRTGWITANDDIAPHAWMPRHQAKLREFIDHAAQSARTSTSPSLALIAWPRVDDAISDVPGIMTFLRTTPGWQVLLEPLALLTPDMHALAEEHLARILGTFAGHPGVWGVLMPAMPSSPGKGPAPALHRAMWAAWAALGWNVPIIEDRRP